MKHNIIRPTQAKIKQAIFNIFQAQIPGSEFLDLFAGTGQIGIEALTRGAKLAVLVENNPPVPKSTKRCFSVIPAPAGIQHLGHCSGTWVPHQVRNDSFLNTPPTFLKQDVFLAIRNLCRQEKKFDFIFADPPYHENLYGKILTELIKYDILKKPGFLILEHYWKEDLPENVGAGSKPALKLWKRKRYGDTVLSIYRKNIVDCHSRESGNPVSQAPSTKFLNSK